MMRGMLSISHCRKKSSDDSAQPEHLWGKVVSVCLTSRWDQYIVNRTEKWNQMVQCKTRIFVFQGTILRDPGSLWIKFTENLKDHHKIGKLCITLRLYGLYRIFQVSCNRIKQPLPPLYLIVVWERYWELPAHKLQHPDEKLRFWSNQWPILYIHVSRKTWDQPVQAVPVRLVGVVDYTTALKWSLDCNVCSLWLTKSQSSD